MSLGVGYSSCCNRDVNPRNTGKDHPTEAKIREVYDHDGTYLRQALDIHDSDGVRSVEINYPDGRFFYKNVFFDEKQEDKSKIVITGGEVTYFGKNMPPKGTKLPEGAQIVIKDRPRNVFTARVVNGKVVDKKIVPCDATKD